MDSKNSFSSFLKKINKYLQVQYSVAWDRVNLHLLFKDFACFLRYKCIPLLPQSFSVLCSSYFLGEEECRCCTNAISFKYRL